MLSAVGADHSDALDNDVAGYLNLHRRDILHMPYSPYVAYTDMYSKTMGTDVERYYNVMNWAASRDDMYHQLI